MKGWHEPAGAKGFTMVEVLVASVLLVVVLGAVLGIWMGLQRTYAFTDEDMAAQQQARNAMNELVEYIRTARCPIEAPEELNLVIVSASANELICWTDTDRDAEHQLELVRFWVDPTTRSLYRDSSLTGDINFSLDTTTVRMITGWVANTDTLPLFTYRGASGASLSSPVSDPTLIREVQIDLRIDIYEKNRPIAHELTSVVQPRNLRQ